MILEPIGFRIGVRAGVNLEGVRNSVLETLSYANHENTLSS